MEIVGDTCWRRPDSGRLYPRWGSLRRSDAYEGKERKRVASVSDQTAIALSTLILASFWIVVSADCMSAPPRRGVKGAAWGWLVSFAVSCLVAAYSLWSLL
jgi:hypothetical protein